MATFATALQENPWPLIQWCAVICASLAAAVTDLRSRRIPNWLTLPMLFSGLAVQFGLASFAGLLDGVAAALIMSAPYVLLFLFAGGGAGDAKHMGAIGAWLGTVQGAITLGSVALLGVVLALVYAHRKQRLRELTGTLSAGSKALVAPLFGAGSVRDVRSHLPGPKEGLKMPYGIAIFAGVLVAAGGRFIWLQ